MENEELIFKKHNADKETDSDKYSVISVRTSKKILEQLQEVQRKTNLSRNLIVCKYIQYGLEHTKIVKNNE